MPGQIGALEPPSSLAEPCCRLDAPAAIQPPGLDAQRSSAAASRCRSGVVSRAISKNAGPCSCSAPLLAAVGRRWPPLHAGPSLSYPSRCFAAGCPAQRAGPPGAHYFGASLFSAAAPIFSSKTAPFWPFLICPAVECARSCCSAGRLSFPTANSPHVKLRAQCSPLLPGQQQHHHHGQPRPHRGGAPSRGGTRN